LILTASDPRGAEAAEDNAGASMKRLSSERRAVAMPVTS